MVFIEKFILVSDSKLLLRAKSTPCKTCVHFLKKNGTCSRFVYINPVSGKTSFPNALIVRNDTFCGFGGKYYEPINLNKSDTSIDKTQDSLDKL